MKYIIIILLFITNAMSATVAGYNHGLTKAQVNKDVKSQNMEKYRDNFETLNIKTLAEKKIIKDSYIQDKNSTKFYIEDNTEFSNTSDFAQKINCSERVNLSKWTATIYKTNPENGIVECLIAPQSDLTNPIGIYKINYINAKKFFKKDMETARQVEATQVAQAKTKFDSIYRTIKTKSDALALQTENGAINLDVPKLFLDTVLTNTDVIDVQATRDLGKLSFKQNVNLSPVAKKIALNDAESFFNIYSGLSDISMKYLIILLLFFGGYGLLHEFSPIVTDKIEKEKTERKHTHYTFGLLMGLLLFVPTTAFYATNVSSANGKILADHSIMQTNFQKMERKGYEIFISWANDAAKIIIDSSMQDIIDKTGIGTANQIVNAYAGEQKYKHLSTFSSSLYKDCKNNFDRDEMYMSSDATKYRYSNNSSTVFPTDETYAYAMALRNGTSNYYYKTLPIRNAYTTGVTNFYNNATSQTTGTYDIIGHYFYPRMSLALCGKTYYQNDGNIKRLNAYTDRLKSLTGETENEQQKLDAIQYIVGLQYQLYNDWGFLSILGLPITKMQTEMIGGLYKNGNSEYINQLNKEIEKNGTVNNELHNFFSALPYLLFPGADTIRKVTASASNSILSSITGMFGGIVQMIAKPINGASSQAAGFAMSITVVKAILALLPILGIILLGTLRFIIILVKAFVLHFSALFLLPVAFARQNTTAITNFTVKLFSVMLEIPLYVLGVWLAIVVYSLIDTIGSTLSKSLIVGAIGNQEANNNTMSTSILHHPLDWLAHISGADNFFEIVKLYIFDGIMELAVAIFSIIIIYKIIITFHSLILETIEIKGITLLDDSVDSVIKATQKEVI